MVTSPMVNTYALSTYTFGTKEPKLEKDTSVADRLARMKDKYATSYNASPLFGSREKMKENKKSFYMGVGGNIDWESFSETKA